MAESPQDLLREYAQLNRKRKSDGVTPLQYLRWQDLKRKLEKAFPGRPVPGSDGKSRVTIEYASQRDLGANVMGNVRPIGLFVHTPFAPPAGERLELRVSLRDGSGQYDGSITVVSNNVGPGFSTSDMGMGVRLNDQGSLYELLVRLRGISAS